VVAVSWNIVVVILVATPATKIKGITPMVVPMASSIALICFTPFYLLQKNSLNGFLIKTTTKYNTVLADNISIILSSIGIIILAINVMP
jgi:hypothetical protein